jgi:hypothetical protein
VTVELYPAGALPATPVRRNVSPTSTLRPTVDEKQGGAVHVEIGGQLVAIDVVLAIALKGTGLLGDATANLEDARALVAGQIADKVGGITNLSVANLLGTITPTETFDVTSLEFTIEYIEAGVRINKHFAAADAPIALSVLERPWIRSVKLAGGGA